MDNIEDLLSSIKAEQKAEQHSPAAVPEPSGTPLTPSEGRSAPVGETHSVEDLLGQLEGHPPQVSSGINAILADLPTAKRDKPLDLSKLAPSSRSSPPDPPFTAAPLPVLQDLKARYLEEQRQREAQEREEQERRRQEQEAALAQQRQDEERQAKEKQARLEKAAQTWLNQLQPLSGEAIWFDEFARHYRSRLEAAIDYLNLESDVNSSPETN